MAVKVSERDVRYLWCSGGVQRLRILGRKLPREVLL